jgi:phosphate starvation-inducible membrane PsiE
VLKSLNSSFSNHCNANTTLNPTIIYFKIGFDFGTLINTYFAGNGLMSVKQMIEWSFSATLISFVDEA